MNFIGLRRNNWGFLVADREVLSLCRGWTIEFFFFVGGGDLFLMGFRGRFIKNFPNVAEGWGLPKIARETPYITITPVDTIMKPS